MTAIEMKTKVNIDDFCIMLHWIKALTQIEGKPFQHEHLLEQAETYRLKGTPLDTSIHSIDILMIDAYHIYHRIKETEEKVNQVMNMIQMPNIFGIGDNFQELIKKETERYEKIFENLMENYKYEDPETRGIQKGFLTERMNKYAEVEDYENAARMRDIIKNC